MPQRIPFAVVSIAILLAAAGCGKDEQPARPAGAGTLTEQQALAKLWALPDVKAWAAGVRSASGGKVRPVSMPEHTDTEGTPKLYRFCFKESHDDHMVRWATFVVDAATGEITVADVDGRYVPLAQWQEALAPTARVSTTRPASRAAPAPRPATRPASRAAPATRPATRPTEWKVITVETPEELVAAIGPERVIRLTADIYDLSKVKQRRLKHVLWSEVHDGWELVVRDVRNLRIEGAGKQMPRIIVAPAYAYVLGFRDVANVELVNIEFSHAPGAKGYCTGGVLRVVGGRDVAVRVCRLLGCGTEGLTLTKVDGFAFLGSSISDCTYGILTAGGCRNLSFKNCSFAGNKEFHGFRISDSVNVAFERCHIKNNRLTSTPGRPLFSAASCSNVRVVGCEITGNVFGELARPEGIVRFETTAVRNNTRPPRRQ